MLTMQQEVIHNTTVPTDWFILLLIIAIPSSYLLSPLLKLRFAFVLCNGVSIRSVDSDEWWAFHPL